MKKRTIFLSLYTALVISLLFMVPVTALLASPVGWSTLPFTDPTDDVYQYTGDTPCDGGKGAYHGEIDIKTVAASGADLIIEFKSTPIVDNALYQCMIYIDMDADKYADYYISTGPVSGKLFLKNVSDSTYYDWSGGSWETSMYYATYAITVNNLSIQDVDEPLSAFASAKYAVVWTYDGEDPTFYGDYSPNDPNCPIPGFPWMLVLFSIITLMGIVFIQRKETTKI